jgi:hypothetical protein
MSGPGDDQPTDLSAQPVPGSEAGGDDACWAHRVCQACGRLNDAERPELCAACGAAFPGD